MLQVEVLTVHPNLTESIYDILGPEDSFGIAQVRIEVNLNYYGRKVIPTKKPSVS